MCSQVFEYFFERLDLVIWPKAPLPYLRTVFEQLEDLFSQEALELRYEYSQILPSVAALFEGILIILGMEDLEQVCWWLGMAHATSSPSLTYTVSKRICLGC